MYYCDECTVTIDELDIHECETCYGRYCYFCYGEHIAYFHIDEGEDWVGGNF